MSKATFQFIRGARANETYQKPRGYQGDVNYSCYSKYMEREIAIFFRDQLRDARAVALRDSEAFEEIIFVLERLGKLLAYERDPESAHNINGLNNKIYDCFVSLLQSSAHFDEVADDNHYWHFHTPFDKLFWFVVNARNAAFHEGAIARHLTRQAIELSLILEDALMTKIDAREIKDFMVKDPVCASLWQPLSLIRERMLTNSFTYLPVKVGGQWKLISDLAIAKFLTPEAGNQKSFNKSKDLRDEQKKRLLQPLEKAIEGGLVLVGGKTKEPNIKVTEVMEDWEGKPILVLSSSNLIGILTPYDLL